MNRFHLYLLVTFLILSISPSIHVLRTSFTNLHTGNGKQQKVFDYSSVKPPASSHQARDMESEKRKVPTGSNPLHNRR
uniref:Uncharacterized protein n=1 Tax=Nelumbo nucifera TaxID=4432 RepID=A0A822XTY0_NELNU|nr:TPA_asm: hypothetical protein HUJ06_024925 [Nelumbo nucifera]